MIFIFERPIFEHLPQVKLRDYLVGGDQSVHVRFKAKLRIYTFLVKFDFYKVIRIGSDDEVDFSPIDHDDFLNVIHDVRQLLSVYLVYTLVVSTWLKISVEDFVLVKPLGLKDLVMSHFVGVILTQEGHNIVSLGLWRQEAIRVLPDVRICT